MSEPMNPRTKLILMNCAVAVALVYRWWKGTPLVVLAITALIMFTLVNVLILFTQKKSRSINR
jgi:Flp pilus assembly protein TadB